MVREISLEHPGTIALEKCLNRMDISQYALRYRACANGDGTHDLKNSSFQSLSRTRSSSTTNAPHLEGRPDVTHFDKPASIQNLRVILA